MEEDIIFKEPLETFLLNKGIKSQFIENMKSTHRLIKSDNPGYSLKMFARDLVTDVRDSVVGKSSPIKRAFMWLTSKEGETFWLSTHNEYVEMCQRTEELTKVIYLN